MDQNLEAAEQLFPGCALYSKTRGFLLAQRIGRLGDSSKLLSQALRLNSRDAAIWIELGLQDEIAGHFSSAESKFLTASQVDNTFAPRWALANFYFRRNDPARFVTWAKRSAEMVYGDPTPLFRLSLNMIGDSSEVLSRVVVARPTIIGSYLRFTVAENRLADGVPIARTLLQTRDRNDVADLLAFINRLLKEYPRSPELLPAAVELWNGMIDQNFLPFRRIDGDSWPFLINADFSNPITSQAFDWRMSWPLCVYSCFKPFEVLISLSGRQPEMCDVLYQLVPVEHDSRYQFSLTYNTNGTPTLSNMWWRVLDEADGSEIAKMPYLASTTWRHEQMQFTTAHNTRLLRFILSYRRQLGTVPTEGTLLFKDLDLRPVQ